MGEFYGQSYLVDPRGQFVAVGQPRQGRSRDRRHGPPRDRRSAQHLAVLSRPAARDVRGDGRDLMPATQLLDNGIVTLTRNGVAAVSGNAELWNDDLRPCTREEHNWGASRFASLWIGMCLCIPTYSLASGMISLGMSLWQAVLDGLHRQRHRADPDLARRTRGDALRFSVSGVRALVVRHAWRSLAVVSASRDRGRVVRHQLVVRRLSARCNSRAARALMACVRRTPLDCVRCLLAAQRGASRCAVRRRSGGSRPSRRRRWR